MAADRELTADYRHADIRPGGQAERLELPCDLERLGDRGRDRVQLDPDGAAREPEARRQVEAECVGLEAAGNAPLRDDELPLGIGDVDERRGAVADLEAQVLRRDLHHRLAGRIRALLQREVADERLARNLNVDGRPGHADEAVRGIRGVHRARQRARDGDARHVDHDAAGEGAGDPRARDREARAGAGETDETVREAQRCIVHRELRAGGALGEGDVARQGLAEDLDAEPLAGDSDVRTGRQAEHTLAAADAQDLIDDLRRLVDLDRDGPDD